MSNLSSVPILRSYFDLDITLHNNFNLFIVINISTYIIFPRFKKGQISYIFCQLLILFHLLLVNMQVTLAYINIIHFYLCFNIWDFFSSTYFSLLSSLNFQKHLLIIKTIFSFFGFILWDIRDLTIVYRWRYSLK